MTDGTYSTGSWSLDEIFPSKSGPEIERAFAEVEAAATELERKRPILVPEIDETAFVEILGLVESLAAMTHRLDGYAILSFFEDLRDQEALALRGRVDQLLASTQNRTLVFDLWWKALDDENAQRLLNVAGDNAYYLETLRSSSAYTLSEAEEQVINLKNVNGAHGLVTLYMMITNGMTYDAMIDGEKVPLSRSQVMSYALEDDPVRREAAYRAFLSGFEARSEELVQIYQCIVNDWRIENIYLRAMSSPISVRNLDNGLPDDVVDVLLETCRANVGLYQRFFKLKAEWLGLPKLRRFDIFAPLGESEIEIPFADGVELVLQAFHNFSPKLAELAKQVMDAGHVDSSLRPGKRGGGLSWDALPGMTPWILINYGDRASDVSTLAHELGHAVHAMMAADHSVLTFSPSLPMAETASNFASILLLEGMLDSASQRQRKILLANYIDASYMAIARQSFSTMFERQAHQLIADGATADELSAAYLDALHEQFGDSVEVDDLFKNEWISFAHFYNTPFYDYSYAFGMLLVLGLLQRYKREGDAFVPKYLQILAYGGSKAPIAILDEHGFDIRTREFWQGGFDVLAGMIDELASLA